MIITLTGATFSNNINSSMGARYSITYVCKANEDGSTLTPYYNGKTSVGENETVTFNSSNTPRVNGYSFLSATPAKIENPTGPVTVEVKYEKVESDAPTVPPIAPPSDTNNVLVSTTGATLLKNTAMSATSSTPTSNASYYTYQFIPVIGGTTYRMQYARRVWELDSNKAELKSFAAHNDVENYTFTVGDTTAYISVTVKTTEIDPAELTLETIS